MDIVATVPMSRWADWLTEGDLANGGAEPEPWERLNEYGMTFGPGSSRPAAEPGERLYIVAHGKLRGYSPITAIATTFPERFGGRAGGFAVVRRGEAVAVTISVPVKGFQNWRYRWWDRETEVPFPEWKTP